MPRYSFNLPETEHVVEMEFPDDNAAWSEAVTVLGKMLEDVDGALPRAAQWQVLVTDGQREVARIDVTACLQGYAPDVPRS